MENYDAINIFKLPNPGTLLFYLIAIHFLGGLFTVSAYGLFNYIEYRNIFTVLSNYDDYLLYLNLIKYVSLFSALIPITYPITIIAIVFLKPFFTTVCFRPRDLHSFDTEIVARMEKLLLDFGIQKKVRLMVTDKNTHPKIYGLFKPTVLLPAKMFIELEEEQQDAMVLHEIAHYKNNDLLVIELLKSTVIGSFVGNITWLALLSLCFVFLIWTFITNDPLIFLFGDSASLDELIKLIVDVNILPFFFMILSMVIVLFANQIILVLRERRADIRLRFYSQKHFIALVTLISKGTKKPSCLERMLLLGTNNWSRHESLIDPQRLLRPNAGVILIFGMTYSLLISLSPLNLLNTVEFIAPLNNNYLTTLRLVNFASLQVNTILYLFIPIWLIISAVSYNVGKTLSLKNMLMAIFWYSKMVVVFGVGSSLIPFLFGSMMTSLLSTIIGSAFLAFNPLFIITLFLALTIQSIMLGNYLVVMKSKDSLAFWLVYVPSLLASIPMVTGIHIILNLNPGFFDGVVEFQKLVLSTNINMEQLLQFTKQTLTTVYVRPPILTIIIFSFVSWIGFVAILLLINVGFDKCCYCGTETRGKFSVEYKCGKCGFPLGSWIQGGFELSIRKFDFSKTDFHWKTAILMALKEKFIMLIILGVPSLSGYLSFRIFTSSTVIHFMPSIIVRSLLGVITFILSSIILVILVLSPFALLWKDIFDESDS